MFNPALIFEHLHREGARVVLIGGLAAVALGVPITTNDIDFCYAPDNDNIDRIVRAITPLHPRLRVGGLTDAEASLLPFMWDSRTLRDSPNVTLETDAGALDLMTTVAGVGTFDEVFASAVTSELFGLPISILDLPSLIASKSAAGRNKDLLALPQIEAALRLRDDEKRHRTDGGE